MFTLKDVKWKKQKNKKRSEVRMLQFAPVICEQGPSAPSSPTSPGGSRLRRPRPLNADAMERISVVRSFEMINFARKF